MSINPNEDTEFNDALRKHGILPPLEPTPPSPSPPPSPSFDDLLNDFTPTELQELGEESKDDDTERFISAYRKQRLADERREGRKAIFGRVYPIGREDYQREVTDTSNVDEEDDDNEKGTAVICFLYKDGLPRSDRTFQQIHVLAAKYPRTKFVSIVGDKCIPNLPESRIPMILYYRKGDIRNQILSWGADRDRQQEELEAYLLVTGALVIPEVSRPAEERTDKEDEDEAGDELDDDPSSRMRSAVASTNAKVPRNVRGPAKKGDDSDSDFDFDL